MKNRCPLISFSFWVAGQEPLHIWGYAILHHQHLSCRGDNKTPISRFIHHFFDPRLSSLFLTLSSAHTLVHPHPFSHVSLSTASVHIFLIFWVYRSWSHKQSHSALSMNRFSLPWIKHDIPWKVCVKMYINKMIVLTLHYHLSCTWVVVHEFSICSLAVCFQEHLCSNICEPQWILKEQLL